MGPRVGGPDSKSGDRQKHRSLSLIMQSMKWASFLFTEGNLAAFNEEDFKLLHQRDEQ